MFKFSLSFYITLLAACFSVNQILAQNKSTNIQVHENKKVYIHKIEKGQSLYAISKIYGVAVDEIYKFNPELKDGAKAGQEIRIPFVTSAAAPIVSSSTVTVQTDTSKYITHKIVKGETIYALCRKYNLSERQLAAYNPSLSEGLKEGQVIVIGEKNKSKLGSKPVNLPKTASTTKSFSVDSSQFRPISKEKKENYNVALALPFRLDQTLDLDLNSVLRSGGSFPAIPGLAVDFYLGFKYAIDSLTAKNFEVNLELYDIDDKDSLQLSNFTYEAKFKEHDIIFGPLYANGFKAIAKKAKEYHIPIVSPITQQNKILYNNIYISKTNPSQFTLLESLVKYCVDSLMEGKCNVMLVNTNEKNKRDANFTTAFRKYFLMYKKENEKLNDTLKLVNGIEGVKLAYVPDVKNIIVNLTTNPVMFSEFTTQLSLFKKEKDIVFCGWENNSSNDNIDQQYLNELNYTFPYQFNLIESDSKRDLVNKYLNSQNTCPSEYYFMGFEVAYYFLKNLKEFGPEFIHKLDEYPMEMNHMRFKFNRPDLSTGFDNQGVYIYRYSNYTLCRTGWK